VIRVDLICPTFRRARAEKAARTASIANIVVLGKQYRQENLGVNTRRRLRAVPPSIEV